MIDDDETPVPPELPQDDEPVRAPRAHGPAPRRVRVEQTRARREAARLGARRAPRAERPTRAAAAVGARITIAVLVLVAIVGVIVFGVWSTLYRAEASVPAGRTVTITVPKGASGDDIASMLAKAGVVTNSTMFRIRTAALGASGKMKTGTYEFTTGTGYDAAIRLLEAGPQIEYVTFTIPEGWGIEAIAARVEAKFGIPAAEFVDLATTGAQKFDFGFLADDKTPSLEGYLFPKTYTLKKKGTTATDVINVMLTQYGKETAVLDYAYAQSKGVNPHEVLTIASIIEREAQLEKDRPKVASVIYNRLRIGMRLQLDSTVQYALHGKVKLNLNDLKTQSPYNTYVNTGVPPGPICNPGLSSIDAALHPAKTDYIYYILTGKDGSQSFTNSYAKFLQYKDYLATKGLK